MCYDKFVIRKLNEGTNMSFKKIIVGGYRFIVGMEIYCRLAKWKLIKPMFFS